MGMDTIDEDDDLSKEKITNFTVWRLKSRLTFESKKKWFELFHL